MTPSTELKVVVCQLTSIDDVDANLEMMKNSLFSVKNEKPRLICFPENCLYLRIKEGEKIVGLQIDDRAIRALADWARTNAAYIHLGSVPLVHEAKLYNSSILIDPDGGVKDIYRKVHLFDVDVEGHAPVRESDAFARGEDASIIEIDGWKIGNSICYDLRFSELYLRYARANVDAILIPSAFLVPTGQAHWSVLTRARAIESQAYVLAAAQGGVHQGKAGGRRMTYGHSIAIDPWGVVLAESPDAGGPDSRILRVTLRRERIEKVRAQIPMKNHRRLV